IANEYSEFNVAPNLNIKGKLVTGEAIADLGGATLALAAYEKSLEGKPRRTIDGFTPEQRFFLGFAQVWAENMAMEEQTRRALTLIEPHVPRRGEAFETLLDRLFDDYIPRSFNAASPGYLAFVPGGGIFHAAVADLIADAVNRYTGVAAAAPALVQIEMNVLRWFCEMVGYGKGSGGVLTTGGSLANLTAVVAARRALLPDDFLRGTLYCGDQVHHAFQKSAMVAGFPLANVREIP